VTFFLLYGVCVAEMTIEDPQIEVEMPFLVIWKIERGIKTGAPVSFLAR
jgi:hypothetical protein